MSILKREELEERIVNDFPCMSNDDIMSKYGISRSELMRLQTKYKFKKSKSYLKSIRVKKDREPDDDDKKVFLAVQDIVGLEYTYSRSIENLYIRYITWDVLNRKHGDKERIGRLLGRDRCSCYNYEKKFEGLLRSDTKFKRLYNEAKKVCNI